MPGAFDLSSYASPEEVRRRIGKTQLAQAAPTGSINDMIYRAAAGGNIQLGQALEGAFGLEQPEVTQARKMQNFLSGIDFTDRESIGKAASEAGRLGDPRLQIMLSDRFLALAPKDSETYGEIYESPKAKGVFLRKNLKTNKTEKVFIDPAATAQARQDVKPKKGAKALPQWSPSEGDLSRFDTLGTHNKQYDNLEDQHQIKLQDYLKTQTEAIVNGERFKGKHVSPNKVYLDLLNQATDPKNNYVIDDFGFNSFDLDKFSKDIEKQFKGVVGSSTPSSGGFKIIGSR